MRRLLLFVLVLIIAASAFSGTISGSLDYPEGTVADTFLLIVTDQFENLMAATLGSTTIPFEWELTDEFCDTVQYYAFAGKTSAATLIPVSGDPAGVYPDSPFNTVGGEATGIDIPIATSADISGNVQWSGSFDNVYVNTYDLYFAYTTGDTVVELENIEVGDDGTFFIDDCPTGPKSVMAYVDENGNLTFDEGEPFAQLQNELMGVLVVGGGYDAEILPEQLNLDLWFVKESTPKPATLNMFATPNPFNGAVSLVYNVDSTEDIRIDIFNSNGQLVNTLFDGNQAPGNHTITWNGKGQFGQDLSTGIYTVTLSSVLDRVSTKIIYIK